MILDIFLYNLYSGKVELNDPTLLLIKEFAVLLEPKRNKCKLDPKGEKKIRAFKELSYIYLCLSWKSPYNSYSEQERHLAALEDSGLSEEEFNDPDFRAACRKFRSLQDSNKSIQLLNAARTAADKFTDYFETLDLNERDESTGKPIFLVKNVMAEISLLSKVYEQLKILEDLVKKEMTEQSSIRAGAVDGFHPVDI